MRSCPLPLLQFLLRSCTPSLVSCRASFLSITRCLGTQCRCMGFVLVLIARFASPACHLTLRGDTPWWNAAGAVSSISFSAARLPRLVARIPLIFGLISWIFCLVTLLLPRGWVRQALHVDSFDPEAVSRVCMPWLLDPFCFLSACPHSVCAAVCSVPACYVFLVGASVADPAGERAFAAGLMRSSLRPLSLPSSSRVTGRCSSSFRPSGLRPKPFWGEAWSPIRFFPPDLVFFL
jgi:hypothetical protein